MSITIQQVTGGGGGAAGAEYYASKTQAATGIVNGWAIPTQGISGGASTSAWSKAGGDMQYVATVGNQGLSTISTTEPILMATTSSDATSGDSQLWASTTSSQYVFGSPYKFLAVARLSDPASTRHAPLVLTSNVGTRPVQNDTLFSAALGDSGVGFHYSTARGDTNYQCIVGNGTSQTTADTGVAATNTSRRFEIALTASGATFYIDGVQVCSGMSMTNFPASGTLFGWVSGGSNLAASVRTFSLGGVWWSSQTGR